jgi:hypothetical protein
MIAQDSAKFWFPKLASHPWQWMRDWLPKTVLIDYSEEALSPSLRGEHTAEYDRLYYAVDNAIAEMDGPAFIRTDITSAKHAGRSAYIVEKEEDLNHALLTTLSHSQLKTYHGKMKASAIMVREFIKVKADRTAFGGLPIGKEWRIFADQRGVQCVHGYWPKEALIEHMDDGQPPRESPCPTDYWIRTDALDAAAEAAKAMGGLKWSVDFAEDVSGKVWLIDMATAANSYHPLVCKFSGLDDHERI